MNSLGSRVLVAFLFASFATMPLVAQAPTAAVTGVVRDSAGGRTLRDVEVIVRDVETELAYRAATAATGRYSVRGLRPGRYEVTARRIGYRAVMWPNVSVPVGRTITLDFVLSRTAVPLEPLVVTADAALLDVTQSEISFVLDREMIALFPEESRDLVDLARLSPGATSARGNNPGEAAPTTSIGGLNNYSTGLLVDGGNMIGGSSHDVTGSFPLLAIQEFEVLTASYSAEFGQAASGVISAVTRRGTNEFQAEGFGVFRHHRLNALGAFEQTKPPFHRAHWGAAVGGPITRNQTHFFVAFERKDENAFATVETGGAFPALEGTFDAPLTKTLIFGRVDHRFAPSHELMVRWGVDILDSRTEIGESGACASAFFHEGTLSSAQYGVDRETRSHSIMATHRWVPSDGVLNQATIHLSTQRDRRNRITDAPGMIYPRICTGGNGWAWDQGQDRLEFKEVLSLATGGATGSHHLRVGAHVQLLHRDSEHTNYGRGSFHFGSDTAALPFLYVRNLSAPFGSGATNTQLAFFAQDDWTPASRLTLNLGIRYDVETNGTNQDYVIEHASTLPFVSATPRPADLNNLAPRIGLTWLATGDRRTVVRAGFGIFYDQLRIWQAGLESTAFVLAFIPNPGTTNPDSLPPLDPDTFPVAALLMDSVMRTPLTRQFSLGIERDLSHDLVVGIDGMFIQGRNLPFLHSKNSLDASFQRPFMEFGPVGLMQNLGEAEAKMLILSVTKVFPWGRVDGHYTLADRKSTADYWLETVAVPDSATDFSSEFGPAGWDERHRLVLLGHARLPLGFSVAVKGIYSSARPFNAFTSVSPDGLAVRAAGEGRNARRGPDFFQLDVGLRRHFTAGAGDVRAVLNVYNLLNRTNLSPASAVGEVASPLFGQALVALPKRQAELGLEIMF